MGGRNVWRRVHFGVEAVRYPNGGDLHRVPPKVGVARGHLHLRVTEQFPNYRQALPEGECTRGEVVPEVMDWHIVVTASKKLDSSVS